MGISPSPTALLKRLSFSSRVQSEFSWGSHGISKTHMIDTLNMIYFKVYVGNSLVARIRNSSPTPLGKQGKELKKMLGSGKNG